MAGNDDHRAKLARNAWVNAGAPIVALVLIIAIGAFATLLSFAHQQNRAFSEGSRRLVQNTLDGRARTQADIDLDFASWNDAYRAVVLHWDPRWVSGNFYSSVTDALIVFNDAGEVRYSWVGEAERPNQRRLTIAVARAARETFELPRLARAPRAADTVARSFVRLDGRLAIIAVAPVAPENDNERLSRFAHGPIWYLGVVQLLDESELADLGRSLDLGALSLNAADEPSATSRVALSISAANGRPVGVLSWADQRPGDQAFGRQVMPVMLGLLVIGVLTIVVARSLVLRQVAIAAKAEAMEDANRLKSEFLATMSHELRTPLNAIIGYAELICEESAQDPAYDAVREDAGQVIRAGRRLQSLVSDILDQSRIEAGRLSLRAERVLVRELMDEAEAMFAPLARAGGNSLDIARDHEQVVLFVDPHRARQCLFNLVSNAVKFTEGGRISVRARKSLRAGAACITFDVADTGMGVAREDAHLIFEPFAQSEEAARRHGGAGLGLSIARKLARAMGGDISFASEPGKGSCFSLTLPVGSVAPAAIADGAVV